MVQAKLLILGQEIELLWVKMKYIRKYRKNGKVKTDVMDGLIKVCYATDKDTDLVLRWMTKENIDNTWNEVDKMEKGKVCFYENGFDYPPTKTYEFNDAHLIYFEEIFNAEGENPMQTILTISPAIQNYGVEFIKRWNESWVPPSERMPYQPIENEEPKVLDYYLTDLDGNRIDKSKIGEKVFLNIETKNLIGELLTISLNDKKVDFKYNDEILQNDAISNYKITNNLEKLKLVVIEQKDR
ncbi:type VI secretion system tube protein TssD [Tenacibaculum finnmarkense]|uniref:type VI secretion system tube protein TssD n=1 Tax=Tenacibaculum finnmarkense TaxID=2781243 RepID=UPI000C680645|nr:type VI secretion system tube protein TssD [Tenacibaculum finnmarkense]MCD8440933.1 hypothetical protein [Tenacibaculum finnmarkense genomovar ulcerans]MCG8721853.1 hypothetical protein [Tenacibaculum finnmarkense]SOS56428.1 conserved hypothetical protein [Tenacibaculum finnmarkense]